MTTATSALITLLVLGLVGFFPVLGLVGPRLVALPLCPLAGSVLAALGAMSCVALPGSLLMWFDLWSLAAGAVSLVLLLRRPGLGEQIMRGLRREARAVVLLGAAVVALAVGWALRTVRIPNIGFDTRAIWLLHAHWLSRGHAVVLANMRNHFFVVSHPSYPPLVSSVMALSWRLSGTGTDRVAVVTVALLNGCALFVAGWAIVEAARRAAVRTERQGGRRHVLVGLGVVIAALVVLVAGGVLGTFATNGYADPLWSLCAVGAVLFGLVLEPTASDLGMVGVLVGVVGLSKVEGTAIAVLLVLAVGARRLLRRDRPGPGWNRRPVVAMAVGVVALGAWQMLTVVVGVPPDASLTGRGQGSLAHRVAGTWDAAVPHLHVVILAVGCGLAGLLVLRHLRQRLGMGNDLWAWGTLVAAAAVLGGAYVLGPGNLQLWLATSVNRTTIFVALLAWWIVGVWALCGTAGVLE